MDDFIANCRVVAFLSKKFATKKLPYEGVFATVVGYIAEGRPDVIKFLSDPANDYKWQILEGNDYKICQTCSHLTSRIAIAIIDKNDDPDDLIAKNQMVNIPLSIP